MATQTPDLPAPAPAKPPEADPVAQTLALLQPWIEYVPQRQRRLGLFIFLAFLVHLAAFFFIRIDTTRAELRHETRTHVSIESPAATSAQDQQPGDHLWDRLTDPRLFLLPQPPSTSLTPDGEPPLAINADLGSNALPPAASPESFQFVHPDVTSIDQRVAETLHPSRQPFAYAENPPAIAAKSTWVWGDTLAQRQPVNVPDLPSPVSDTDLGPTQLRVAIDPSGAVEHVLVEQSCGSGRLDLDQQAVLAARKIRFHSTDQPGLTWDRITVFWRYAAKPREEVVPTPPSGT